MKGEFEHHPYSPQARAGWVPRQPRTRAEQARVSKAAAELRALLPQQQAEGDVIHVAMFADGLMVVIGPEPVHGPGLPSMEDVWRAQASAHDALNSKPADFERARAELVATEKGFALAAEREVDAMVSEMEAGQ